MKQIKIPAVLGLPVRPDKTFLLTKRHQPSTPIWHNKWNIPGGGIEWGETPEEALVREFAEELGVVPKLLSPYPVPVTALWYGKDTGFDTDSHVLLLAYPVDIGDQKIDLTLDPEHETSEVRWFTLDEMKKLDSLPKGVETVTKLLNLMDKHDIL